MSIFSAKLTDELGLLADAVGKCIYENAHVALDQAEYQKRYDGLITEFQPTLWYGLVDYMTVYTADDVRVTFKNGMEIKA